MKTFVSLIEGAAFFAAIAFMCHSCVACHRIDSQERIEMTKAGYNCTVHSEESCLTWKKPETK